MASTVRILSLDGGGIRGLSSLMILERIMSDIREANGLDSDPKPSEHFDLIGGTSTGGIIATLLGRLGLSAREAITAYKLVAEEAFQSKRWSWLPAPPNGEFSATSLERAIKKTIGNHCGREACVAERRAGEATAETCPHREEVFRDDTCLKTVVLAVTKNNVNAAATLFKTYDKSAGFKDCKIWEVVRATSAATTFFKSIKCGLDEIEFIDAGFGYNNPCQVLLEEAKIQFPDAQEFQILSIGTGLGDVVTIKNSRMSILKALKDMASNSDRVAREMDKLFQDSDRYFRFNVVQGLKDVTLSDWEKTSQIAAHTHNYISVNERRFKRCAARLVQLQNARRDAGAGNEAPPIGRDAGAEHGATDESPAEAPTDAAVARPTELPPASIGVATAEEIGVATSPASLRPGCDIFTVPLDFNPNYITREAPETKLASFLRPRENATNHPQRAALCGLGGSGKTEIAVRFAQDYRSFYSAIFWINGVDKTHLVDGFSLIAREVGVGTGQSSDGNVELAADWLIRNLGWLLVVDNVDSDEALSALRRDFLRAGMRGSILITSRNESVKLQWNTVDIVNMEEGEAQKLLARIAGDAAPDVQSVSRLLRSLGHLPLAIDQAASYIRESQISVSEYLELYEKEKSEYLKEFPSTQYNFQSRETVMTTWTISFESIKKENPEAALLLQLLSLLDAEDIPVAILESCMSGEFYWAANGEFLPAPPGEAWIPGPMKKILCDRKGYISAKKILRKFSFIRNHADPSLVYIHPLVHYWAAHSLSDKDTKDQLALCLVGLVTSVFQKQDRIAPYLPRVYGVRGLEEGRLGIWPWRQYPALAGHARTCLVLAKRIKKSTALSTLALPLLQVLEYSTFGGGLELDNTIVDRFLDSLDRNDTDGYIAFSAEIWRLQRSNFCSCRKRSALCGNCVGVYSKLAHMVITRERQTPTPPLSLGFQNRKTNDYNNMERSERTRSLAYLMKLRLGSDPAWYTLHSQVPELPYLAAVVVPIPGNSWMGRYVVALENYLRLKASGESSQHQAAEGSNRRYVPEYGMQLDFIWRKGLGKTRSESEKAEHDQFWEKMYSDLEKALPKDVRQVWISLKDLCGEESEECRRAAFYVASAQTDLPILEAQVNNSIRTPSPLWSHERCIIKYIHLLLRYGQHDQAADCIRRTRIAYRKAGLTLKAAEKAFAALEDVPSADIFSKDIQIFVKSLNGVTKTIQTTPSATVESILYAVEERDGHIPQTIRLIYAGKQLDKDRMLYEYNISGGETLHLVLRLLGG